MKTIVEALQDLYVAMGGEESDVSELSLNPDIIEQIADLVESGGTNELPVVTAADNDKVLAVVNGAWDKAEASGGGVMVVNVDVEITPGPTPIKTITSVDKTFGEIESAIDNGIPVIVKAVAAYGANPPMTYVLPVIKVAYINLQSKSIIAESVEITAMSGGGIHLSYWKVTFNEDADPTYEDGDRDII